MTSKKKFRLLIYGGTEKQYLSLEIVLHRKKVNYRSGIVWLRHVPQKFNFESTLTSEETEKMDRICQYTPCLRSYQIKKKTPTTGLEPQIFYLGVERLLH